MFFIDKLYPHGKIPSLVHIYDKYMDLNIEADKYLSASFTEPD